MIMIIMWNDDNNNDKCNDENENDNNEIIMIMK